jgi:hypothetical protein
MNRLYTREVTGEMWMAYAKLPPLLQVTRMPLRATTQCGFGT